MKRIGQAALLSLPLCLAVEFYLRLIQDGDVAAGTKYGTITLLLSVGFMLLPGILVFHGATRTHFAGSFLMNLGSWFFVALFIAVDAFTRHPGLANNMDRSFAGFVLTLLAYWILLGLPLALLGSAISWLVCRFWLTTRPAGS